MLVQKVNKIDLNQDEKEAEIIALRKQSFDAAQWRRIEALERNVEDAQVQVQTTSTQLRLNDSCIIVFTVYQL